MAFTAADLVICLRSRSPAVSEGAKNEKRSQHGRRRVLSSAKTQFLRKKRTKLVCVLPAAVKIFCCVAVRRHNHHTPTRIDTLQGKLDE